MGGTDRSLDFRKLAGGTGVQGRGDESAPFPKGINLGHQVADIVRFEPDDPVAVDHAVFSVFLEDADRMGELITVNIEKE